MGSKIHEKFHAIWKSSNVKEQFLVARYQGIAKSFFAFQQGGSTSLLNGIRRGIDNDVAMADCYKQIILMRVVKIIIYLSKRLRKQSYEKIIEINCICFNNFTKNF